MTDFRPDMSFYEKFVGWQQDPNETDPNKDRFLRWSFFSLASAVVNNNWGVFCTLLDIGVDPNTTNPSPTAADNVLITYELFSHIFECSSNIVSLFKELENIRIDA